MIESLGQTVHRSILSSFSTYSGLFVFVSQWLTCLWVVMLMSINKYVGYLKSFVYGGSSVQCFI
jgi:hypothetical protein